MRGRGRAFRDMQHSAAIQIIDDAMDEDTEPSTNFMVEGINWFFSASSKDRLTYIKAIFRTLEPHEVRAVKNMQEKEGRRFYKAGISCPHPKKVRKPITKPRKLVTRTSPNREDLVEEASATLESVPGLPESVPIATEAEPEEITQTEPIPWWSTYGEKDIVSLDCEFVTTKDDDPIYGNVRAALVAVATIDGIFNFKIRHKPGSYDVNAYSWHTNGITFDNLDDGKDFLEVRSAVQNLIQNKLVIVVNGATDFSSLHLNLREYDVFDLHRHFKTEEPTTNGGSHAQPLSLRALVKHYFHVDIQSGSHSAEDDAKYTLRLFNEIYVRIKRSNVNYRDNFDFSEFSGIERPKKRKPDFRTFRMLENEFKRKCSKI